MFADDSVPMNYYRALREIRDQLPRDAIVCSEGANTMDIGRTVLPNFAPRHRLDAGTFGTMGVGLGFAIAAAVAHPEKKVVAVEGDSAFGFSGMEVETACRYRLPITFVILNNNGIGGGVDEFDPANVPVSVYTPRARYEKIVEAFGGRGFFVDEARRARPRAEGSAREPGADDRERHAEPARRPEAPEVRLAHALSAAHVNPSQKETPDEHQEERLRLRRGPGRDPRRSERPGLLPLQLVPRLARRADPRLHALAGGEREGGEGQGEARDVQEDREQPPPVLHQLRRAGARSSTRRSA